MHIGTPYGEYTTLLDVPRSASHIFGETSVFEAFSNAERLHGSQALAPTPTCPVPPFSATCYVGHHHREQRNAPRWGRFPKSAPWDGKDGAPIEEEDL